MIIVIFNGPKFMQLGHTLFVPPSKGPNAFKTRLINKIILGVSVLIFTANVFFLNRVFTLYIIKAQCRDLLERKSVFLE